jgi:hypothetical protein
VSRGGAAPPGRDSTRAGALGRGGASVGDLDRYAPMRWDRALPVSHQVLGSLVEAEGTSTDERRRRSADMLFRAGWSGHPRGSAGNHSAGRAAFASAVLALVLTTDARADAPNVDDTEEPEPPHRLHISGGFGYAFPFDEEANDAGAEGIGAYAQVEYIYRALEAVTPRAYAGVVFAPSGGNCDVSPCDVSAQILFIGVKGRLLAPIPYVAPFLEIGIGGSLGQLTTRVDEIVDRSQSGVNYHIPFGLGLALGEYHQYELSFQYLFHPAARQFCGAFAFGFEFPLR